MVKKIKCHFNESGLAVIIIKEDVFNIDNLIRRISTLNHKYITIIMYGSSLKISEPFIINRCNNNLNNINFKLINNKKTILDDVFYFLPTNYSYNKFPLKEYIII
jgi:hypothetical protein